METRRRKNSSGDKFSFPTLPIHDQESEFEFGCVTPGSPNSPADHLFFNGRLLPHAFPSQPANAMRSYSRSASRRSSVSSKDSLVSSRSNSTNSSSSCSSARTSVSDASERKPLSNGKTGSRTTVSREIYQANKPVLIPQYGSSQRWQFITPAPVLKHQVSHQKKAEIMALEELRLKNQAKDKARKRSGLCRRFFRSFVSACKECHAIQPSKRNDVLQGNMELHAILALKAKLL
ncbi:hypothetical protein F0562_008955 [Nyssa sinensis]|uniref:Uncharacterized protein n=1 Tax=Nyssa sinensis TaxID=561372 RepID=A0A5J5AAH7_9ASTE|nr:hypothetical protein F0562_008955 [Nyssa sinensis]